jgi:hypothetical protein
MTRLQIAVEAYWTAFDVDVPHPFGISDEYLAEVFEQAVATLTPVPPDFDWYDHLPPGAVA